MARIRYTPILLIGLLVPVLFAPAAVKGDEPSLDAVVVAVTAGGLPAFETGYAYQFTGSTMGAAPGGATFRLEVDYLDGGEDCHLLFKRPNGDAIVARAYTGFYQCGFPPIASVNGMGLFPQPEPISGGSFLMRLQVQESTGAFAGADGRMVTLSGVVSPLTVSQAGQMVPYGPGSMTVDAVMSAKLRL